jgi:MraZ protein
MSFRGRYYHTIDDKGRIILPSRLREAIAEQSAGKLVITSFTGYLLAFPYGEWEILEQKISQQSLLKKQVRAFQRDFMSGAVDCNVDSQGRVLIPPSLREYAGLEKDLVLAGMVRTIEIWSRERWEEELRRTGSQDFSDFMADLGI